MTVKKLYEWALENKAEDLEIDLDYVIKQKYVEREALDKIRAKIDGLTYLWYEVHPRDVIDDVLQIIDKYMTESEVKE